MNTLSVCGDFNNCKIINRFVYEFKKNGPNMSCQKFKAEKMKERKQ